jgi:3',5'-cyclic-AMP phosphodiesterase
MRSFTIAQITDLHLVHENEKAYGVNVRKNFESILNSIKKEIEQIDHLVITGDICFQAGETSIYEWVKSKLDDLGISYSVIPGNHDDVDIMKRVFKLPDNQSNNKEIYYRKHFEGFDGIFLDTSKEYLSDVQIDWLIDELKDKETQFLVFMHHPPIKAGIQFMDKHHSLQNAERFQKLIASREDHIHVFCGHYHAEKEILEENFSVFITPSAIYQFDQSSEEFLVGSYSVGWRKITCTAKTVNTQVSYLSN